MATLGVKKFRESGRRGGRARAANLTPARRSAIAALGREGRAAKKLWGISRAELVRRWMARLAVLDPDLAWYVGTAVRAPGNLRQGMISLLDEQAKELATLTLDEVRAELPQNGGPQ